MIGKQGMVFRMKRAGASVVLAAAAFSVTVQAAQATVRGCEYDVYVKADSIRSTIVPGSSMRSVGEASNSFENSRAEARVVAALYAQTCLHHVMERGGVPRFCIENRLYQINESTGGMTRFKFGSLPIDARKTVCGLAKVQGKTELRNVRIYTKVRGGSEDVRRECSLPARTSNVGESHWYTAEGYSYSPYFTLADFPRFKCRPYQ